MHTAKILAQVQNEFRILLNLAYTKLTLELFFFLEKYAVAYKHENKYRHIPRAYSCLRQHTQKVQAVRRCLGGRFRRLGA
jgi:hypothetical protein